MVPTLAGESWIIPASEITIEERVGGGAFGMVWRGTYAGSCVALKQLFAGMGSEAALTEVRGLIVQWRQRVMRVFGVVDMCVGLLRVALVGAVEVRSDAAQPAAPPERAALLRRVRARRRRVPGDGVLPRQPDQLLDRQRA